MNTWKTKWLQTSEKEQALKLDNQHNPGQVSIQVKLYNLPWQILKIVIELLKCSK